KFKWRVGFLGVILLAIVMELKAVFDSNPMTEPLTGLIIQYIPQWFTNTFIIATSIWALFHFRKWYAVIREKK
ncbi:MAG: hypothetical protein IIB81_00575, partial [Nanoarchaeota archaeon]|nr:hypothetical protein [Nanoarchaeota archaeon]